MKKFWANVAVLAGVICSTQVHANDILGTWTSQGHNAEQILKISRKHDGTLQGQLYNVGKDKDVGPLLLYPITLTGSTFEFEDWVGNYKGKVSADGKSIVGAFDTGGPTQSQTFSRSANIPIDDRSPHKVKLVTVEKGVALEVLDWGGSGPPLILLSGNFNTAHVFDTFALQFTAKHHVYGITRRGFGISSAPQPTKENYDSDRLGDDVLAVMNALKIDRPVLAGHSIGGEELSSIGTRYPEKVSGLIYLDSGYSYALYDPKPVAAITIDTAIAARDLDQLWAAEPSARGAIIQELQTLLPNLQRGLQWAQAELPNQQDWAPGVSPQERVGEVIVESGRKYTGVKAPILAIYASPHQCQPNCDKISPTSFEAAWPAQIAAVEADYPTARIVRIPNANHYVFRSNEAEVVKEMSTFMDGLPN